MLRAIVDTIRNSQFAIRNSQFAIRNSQFAIRNSQFAIRNSKLAASEFSRRLITSEMETLEDRIMLASVNLVAFDYQSGSSGTAFGSFAAQLDGGSGYNLVEVDVADDGFGAFSQMGSGNVVNVPGSISFGTHTVLARATDYMSFMSGGTPGPWKEFHINVSPPPNPIPTILTDTVEFKREYFSGETAHGNLVGKIFESGSPSYGVQVEFDFDRNGEADPGRPSTYVNGIDFTAPASFPIGSHLINARVLEYDYALGKNIRGGWQTLPISILNDSPQINIAGPETIAEGQEGTFTISVLSPFDQSITVTYETQNGIATAGNDYVGKQDQVVIAAGTLRRSFNVATISDLESEGDENFIVSIVAVSAGTIQTNTADVLIEDIPIVSILVNDNTARELGPDTAQFTILRQGGDLYWTIPIELKIGGSAILKDQYTDDIFTAWDYSTDANLRKVSTPDRRTITLAPGEERKVITIIPVRNNDSDFNTSVKFEILPPELPIYNVAPSKEATATIFADIEEEGTLLVNGTIKYDGPVGFNNGMVTIAPLPLRGAEVRVLDSNGLVDDELVGRGFTDDAGKFEIRVNSGDTGSTFGGKADLYLFVIPRSQSSDEVTIGYEVRSYDGELRGIDWKDDIRQGDPGTTITFDKTVPSSEDSDPLNINGTYYAFPVFDAMYSFTRYHATLPGVQKAEVVVQLRKVGNTSYESESNKINIHRGDRFSWDTIGHEYGHYVHDAAGVNTDGGEHSPFWSFFDNKGKKLAFTEGWATYFSQVAQQNTPKRPSSIAGFDDGKSTWLTALWIKGEVDIENEIGFYTIPDYKGINIVGLGEGNEVSVFRVLWDLYDPINDDPIHYSELKVWRLVTSGSAKSSPLLTSLWGDVVAEARQEDVFELGEILTLHQVAASPLNVTVNGVQASSVKSTEIPTFTFTIPFGAQVHSPRDDKIIDQIGIAFYRPDGSRAHTLTYVVPDNPTPDFQFTYTPSAEEWQKIVAASGATVGSPAQLSWSLLSESGFTPDSDYPKASVYESQALDLKIVVE